MDINEKKDIMKTKENAKLKIAEKYKENFLSHAASTDSDFFILCSNA